MTEFGAICRILGDLWLEYRDEEEWREFVEYNDLGLPLAYATANGIVEASDVSETFIRDTWDLFLSSLDVEDTGFDDLEDILGEKE